MDIDFVIERSYTVTLKLNSAEIEAIKLICRNAADTLPMSNSVNFRVLHDLDNLCTALQATE